MAEKAVKDQIDIDRKIVGLFIFAVICAVLLIVNVNLSVGISSGLRAYVAGEGYWTKAQKESVIHLSHYIVTEDSTQYQNFQSVFRIIMGDREGREELYKDNYDFEVVFEGYEQGMNHPEDIPDMIRVLRLFKNFSYVNNAVEYWIAGDEKIDELIEFGENIHQQIQAGEVDEDQKKIWVNQLNELDHELTLLELQFSGAMNNMARSVNQILSWSTIILGLIVISIGFWFTLRFYRATKGWTRTLEKTEEKFRNVLENSRDVLYKMNVKTKEYEYVSPAFKSMLGYEPEEFLNGGIEFILSKMHPDDMEEMQKVVERYESVSDQDFMPTVEFRVKDKDGNWKWISNARTMVRDENGKPEAIVGTVRDISTRKEQEEAIKKSLKEKEVLLQEIHHRVKNNLAIISSLLELQKDGMSEEVQQILSASQLRIKSIAKVHEKLYKSTNLSDTPIDIYIEELAEEIGRTYFSQKQSIDFEIDVLPLSVPINDAIPIGLILNELINNAFKHAFKNLEEGTLRILVEEVNPSKLKMMVASNGHMLDENFNMESSDSLGMTLIQVLVQRIHGELEIIQDGEWSKFIITFSLDEQDQ